MNRVGRWISKRLAAFVGDRRGSILTITALALPVVLVLVCGGIDLASVSADRGRLQSTADAAALAMAKQLGVATTVGIDARADAFVQQELASLTDGLTYQTTTSVGTNNTTVTVHINGQRTSFFGNLVPLGGWRMQVQATAQSLGQLPLCVLSSGAAAGNNIALTGASAIHANACLVQSDNDITVDAGASLQAALTQAAGTAVGPITPSPQTDAPPIADPFASMAILPPGLPICSPVDLIYTLGVNVLAPGIHCGNIIVRKGATVELLPGEHYFLKSNLQMTENSVLTGSNVVMVFDDNSSFQFVDSSTVNLSGRQSGVFAGFVIATTRANTGNFTISTTSAHQLLGTIYIPSATLSVTGASSQVADQSAWTVVVAKSIQLSGSPNLVINANYSASSVPVPSGVGPSAAKAVTLTQ